MFIHIVDDNQFFISVLREMLIKAGFDKITHSSGSHECLERLRNYETPDVVIIDENLCNANGINIMEEAISAQLRPTIIVMTGDSNEPAFNDTLGLKEIIKVKKEGINAQNLPDILQDVLAAKMRNTEKISRIPAFSFFKRSVAGVINF
jgi:DNA-binding NarL/FixJ family response regulator